MASRKEKSESKRKVQPKIYPDEAIAQALKNRHGLQYLAAIDLGMSGSTMSERINSSEYLTSIRDNCRQVRIDAAEHSLTEMVNQKELGAVCFTLKTIGKSRGYTETGENSVDKETIKAFRDMMQLISGKQSEN